MTQGGVSGEASIRAITASTPSLLLWNTMVKKAGLHPRHMTYIFVQVFKLIKKKKRLIVIFEMCFFL